MRLTDLAPKWIVRDGRRIGFTFQNPLGADERGTLWRMSCFAIATPSREQWDLFEKMGDDENTQGSKPTFAWTIYGGIEIATFEAMTVTPSIDGSAGGTWHGHITNGEIK